MSSRIKINYILSNISQALAFEWIVAQINKDKFDLKFILLHDKKETPLYEFLKNNNVPVYFISLSSKKDYLIVLAKLHYILFKTKPDCIHTHLFEASFLGILAGYIMRVPKRIYTRHYSTLQHEYFPHAVKYDKLINALSTHIVSISPSTKSALVGLEKVPISKIIDIPHGFKLEEFNNISYERILKIKEKYNLSNDNFPTVGIISRYLELKGIEYTIGAFQELLKSYPNAHLVLANAAGDYRFEINRRLKLLPKDSYTEIEFESDLFALYRVFDIFVHVPINKDIEAFGQIYIEAMASGIPSIFTKSGIGNEICIDNENCIVVDYINSTAIYNAMLKIITEKDFKNKLIQNGKETANQFDIIPFIEKLEKLYCL
jgi:glycosyltransferase involved in cell wall biosynthesis